MNLNEAQMVRRAAVAARNAQRQMSGSASWFDWVPAYLDRLAVALEAEEADR